MHVGMGCCVTCVVAGQTQMQQLQIMIVVLLFSQAIHPCNDSIVPITYLLLCTQIIRVAVIGQMFMISLILYQSIEIKNSFSLCYSVGVKNIFHLTVHMSLAPFAHYSCATAEDIMSIGKLIQILTFKNVRGHQHPPATWRVSTLSAHLCRL